MTKHRDLVRELEHAGYVRLKSGSTASHDKYRRGSISVMVPRHTEIKDRMADIIRRQAGLR